MVDISPPASGPPQAPTTLPSQPASSPPAAPSPPSPPPPPPPSPPPQASPPVESAVTVQDNYASFGRRFVANSIDGIILLVIISIINLPLLITTFFLSPEPTTTSGEAPFSPLLLFLPFVVQIANLFANIGYPLYFIGSRGQTPGKMVMKIKVMRLDQQEPPGYVTAFLRETVGKFISGLFFFLGYLWMVWDDKKQTWHDKIANTIVVRVE